MTNTSQLSKDDPVIYAIGDIHGEAKRLKRLHSIIAEHHDFAHPERAKKLIHLGDYVDRGEDSVGVIETLMMLQKQMRQNCICLRGNHEAMMLDALEPSPSSSYDNWLVNGGKETIASYERREFFTIPGAHLKWISALPSIHVEKRAKIIFVHAGINPSDYPNEREDIYLWTRARRFFDVDTWSNPSLEGWTVIHGHTPTDDFFPEVAEAAAKRINLDTGAVYGGRLTAAVMAPEEKIRFLYA